MEKLEASKKPAQAGALGDVVIALVVGALAWIAALVATIGGALITMLLALED